MKTIALHVRSCRAERILILENFLVCLACLLIRLLWPMAILPKADIPGMVLLSAAALCCEYYAARRPCRLDLCSMILSGLSFSLLPVCAGLAAPSSMLLMFPAGAAVFALTCLLYGSIGMRMASGPHMPAAPACNALMLYLASRGLMGFLGLFR